jgi:hypothetical protein
MTFQKTPVNSGRRRTLEQVRKDAEAAELYRTGLTFQQVADALGIKSRSVAFNMVKRAIADSQKDALGGRDAFSMILDRIQDHRRKLQEVIDHPSYLAGKDGKIVTMYDPQQGKDVPVVDKGPMVRAITELRHHIELEAKLLDLFPASKSRVEVVTEDVVDREIAKLAEELGRSQQVKTAVPEP